MTNTRRSLGMAVIVATAAIAAFAVSLPNEYVLDDFPAVVDNPAAHWPLDLDGIFTRNYWGSRPNYEALTIYRPLATLSFALVDGLGGEAARWQRLVNILLHAGCSLLVLALGLALLRSGWAAFFAALVFAVHPVHVEAVAGVVSRAELLAALFVLAGAWLLRPILSEVEGAGFEIGRSRFGLAFAGLLFALALLSKENGVTMWGVLVAFQAALWLPRGLAWLRAALPGGVKLTVVGAGDSPPDRTRPAWLRALAPHLLFAVLLGAYMLLRAAVLPAVLGGDVSHGDNPIVGAGWVARVLTPFKVFFEYVRLLVAPAGLTIDYSLDHLKAASSFGDWQALTGLALFIGLLWAGLAAARRSPALAFFILAFFATYSVVSNIPFLSTVIMAERLVYLPSAFFLLALACVAEGLAHPAGGTAGLDLFAVTGEHECKRQDAKCKVQNGHASWLSATIRLRTRLRRDFVGHPPDRRSTRFRPGASLWRRVRRGFRPGLLLVAGAIAVVAVFAAGTVQRCREWRTPFSLYSAAVVTAPDSAKSHHLLANELRRRGEGEVALVHYGRSVRIDGDNFVARTNFARALASSGRYDEALEQLRVALTAAPGYGPAVQIVCGIFERTGRPPGAARVCFPDQAGR